MTRDRQKVEGLLANIQKNKLWQAPVFPKHTHYMEVNKNLKDETWITVHHISTNFGSNNLQFTVQLVIKVKNKENQVSLKPNEAGKTRRIQLTSLWSKRLKHHHRINAKNGKTEFKDKKSGCWKWSYVHVEFHLSKKICSKRHLKETKWQKMKMENIVVIPTMKGRYKRVVYTEQGKWESRDIDKEGIYERYYK